METLHVAKLLNGQPNRETRARRFYVQYMVICYCGTLIQYHIWSLRFIYVLSAIRDVRGES